MVVVGFRGAQVTWKPPLPIQFVNIRRRPIKLKRNMWFSFQRFFIIQGYTPLGHLCVLVVFIISLFAIFGLMWLFVSIFTNISITFNKTLLSLNAITSFSAILDNWKVPVCCWNTIGYSVCDLKRTEKLDHAEESAFGSSSQKIDSFPGQHFTTNWSNIHGKVHPERK